MKKQIIPASPAGRKLSLNKKTISNLNSSEISNVIGGGSNTSYVNACCGGGGKTKNGNTCYGHATCYICWGVSFVQWLKSQGTEELPVSAFSQKTNSDMIFSSGANTIYRNIRGLFPGNVSSLALFDGQEGKKILYLHIICAGI